MKILTAAEMQQIDRLTSERFGVPSLALMENAGLAVVGFLEAKFPPLAAHKIAILCGRGNNGGDGLVVARLLREKGLKPRVLLLANLKDVKGDAAVNLDRLSKLEAPEVAADSASWQRARASLEGTTLLVDALFGTGLSKPLEGFFLEVVRDINQTFPGARIVSVDLPSGVWADRAELLGECVRADATVTFTAPKVAHVFPPACQLMGDWVVRPIGTPPEVLAGDASLALNLITPEDVQWLAKPRAREAHKGTFGHVLIFAGSVGKTGAAAMAAKAALRAGAGLATVATPASALPIVAGLGMEFMTEPLPETDRGTISLRALDYARLDKLVEGKTALAIGPGIGSVPETAEFVRTVVNRFKLPLVLDADGLNAFAGCMNTFKSAGRPAILTPHPGEMARLTGKPAAQVLGARVETAREFAQQFGVTLALKGFRTLVASPEGQVWVNPTGNPGMATGGTGDVLTGVIAGLVAQYPARPAAEVAAAAVYLHGRAGDIAARELGEPSMIAGDVLDRLPRAFLSLAVS